MGSGRLYVAGANANADRHQRAGGGGFASCHADTSAHCYSGAGACGHTDAHRHTDVHQYSIVTYRHAAGSHLHAASATHSHCGDDAYPDTPTNFRPTSHNCAKPSQSHC